jgi:hypothetical protein
VTVLAELVVWHSRPFSPTRRVALGDSDLPTEPPPGFGGILLGAVVAAHMGALDPDLQPELHRLIADVERGQRIVQPRLRHRFQTDRVGLSSSHHRLIGIGEGIDFEFDTKGSAAQQVLGAVYAAATVPRTARHSVATALHKAMRWNGPLGPSFVSYLSGAGGARAWSARAFADPVAWALEVLGLSEPSPDRQQVIASFRARLREVHPDHGGSADDAGQRILDLTEARRILLG